MTDIVKIQRRVLDEVSVEEAHNKWLDSAIAQGVTLGMGGLIISLIKSINSPVLQNAIEQAQDYIKRNNFVSPSQAIRSITKSEDVNGSHRILVAIAGFYLAENTLSKNNLIDKIPSIRQFLNKIDPDYLINRNQVAAQMAVFALFKTLEEERIRLSLYRQKVLSQKLLKKVGISFDDVYELFKKEDLHDGFYNTIDKYTDRIKVDYIRVHLSALPDEKKRKVLVMFSSLHDLTR